MNKTEFLGALRQTLAGMPQEEIDAAIAYYEEYFADAGEENEQQVIKELGTPASLAAQIRADIAIREMKTQPPNTKKSMSAVWLIILAVFASPIALPLALALVIVVFALLIVLFSVLFAFFVAAVAMIAAGVGAVVISVMAIPLNVGAGLAGMGMSLVSVGLGVLIGVLIVQCSRWSVRGIAYLADRMTQRRKGRGMQ